MCGSPRERLHSCKPGVDGGVYCLHSRLQHREAGVPAERRLLRLGMMMGLRGLGQGGAMD